LSIVCESCGRFVIYSVEMLMATRGADAKLIDLLKKLADCPKASSAKVHDRCKPVYAGLPEAVR
jgi:hypothetical protein